MSDHIRRWASVGGSTFAVGGRVAALFLALLACLAAVPYVGHRATVRAALAREGERHAVLVEQVAGRVQAQVEHLMGTIKRLSDSVMALPLDEPHVADEVRTTWDTLAAYPGLDGLALCSERGDLEIRLGAVANSDRDAAYTAGARAAMRNRTLVVDETASQGAGRLSITLAAPIVRPDGAVVGAVVALVDAQRTIDRIFQNIYGRSDVSFTVMSKGGRLLLHSGTRAMENLGSSGGDRCGSCHALPGPALAGSRPVRGGTDQVSISGDERVVAYAPVSLGGVEWTISASTSVADVRRPFDRQARTFLAFTASVVVLLLSLGMLLRRSQIHAIHLANELVVERTMLAANEEKARLASELEASRRLSAIGEMVARVAHEVKNPLHYIGTAADLLSARLSDPTVVGLVADMRTGIRTLDAIVKELLEFSRPMVLARAPVQVNEVARAVAAGASRGAGSVVLALGDDAPTVMADGYRIRQVVENLVRNAQDAAATGHDGAGVVEVGTSAVTGGPLAGGARLWVRDDGPGIPEEDLERIWAPFFTTKTRGTGLGLSVVRRIVDAHGGEVRVRSQLGRGATFEITLPRGE